MAHSSPDAVRGLLLRYFIKLENGEYTIGDIIREKEER